MTIARAPLLLFAYAVVLGSLLQAVFCDEFELALHRKLMKNYQKHVRPSVHFSHPTNVTLGFSLHQLIDVNEKDQVISTSSWLNMNWLDPRLRWNSSQFGGIKLMHIPAERIWRPDIVLTNNADPKYKDVVVSTEAFFTSDGNVTWLAFAIFQSSCQIAVRYYPFDDQECKMTFSSWSYDGRGINLTTIAAVGDMSNFMSNGEFHLLSIEAQREEVIYSCCVHNLWPIVNVLIRLRRRPLFYVFNHILPCLIITCMALLGFCIPADTGEKITMGITTMLSMGIFLKTINENMPATGDALPLIGMYYTAALFIVCGATVLNVFILNVHHQGSGLNPAPVPIWLKHFLLGVLGRFLFIRLPQPDTRIFFKYKDKLKMATMGKSKKQQRKISSNYYIPLKSNKGLKRKFATVENFHQHTISRPVPQPPQRDLVYQNILQQETSEHPQSPPLWAKWSGQSYSNFELTSLTKKISTAGGIGASPEQVHPKKSVEFSLPSAKPADSKTKCDDQLTFKEYCIDSDYVTGQENAALTEFRLKLELESTFSEILSQICETLNCNERRLAAKDRSAIVFWEWKIMASIIDRLLLCVFVALTASTSFVMLIQPTFADTLFVRMD